ncbi:MAG: FixG Ig-like domain-containing protein [Terracidiphilus sp.]|nr:FixG Ig-like domain-containing protein [Terracidiphilus sp.]
MASIQKNSKNTAPRVTLPGTQFHRVRKTIQYLCVTVFILLPLSDVMRVDLVRQRFYFFGAELWISEFSIIFFTMMFLWILIAAMAMIYGRFYCGYLCPQMIFSEAANAIEKAIARRVDRKLTDLSPRARRLLTLGPLYVILLPASVFFSFVFVSFFIPPVDLIHRLLSFDIRTAGSLFGVSVTLLTFLDFAFLRQRFCTSICPYGYLQNMLADSHTLQVFFQDESGQCIHCDKCVRACPMGIDIRKSSHQLECTHCAECIDACSGVLGRMGRQTLIHYAWGDAGRSQAEERRWYRRIGFRDGKRIAVLVLLSLYATGIAVVINMRQPVLVRIMPNRITLYTRAPDGSIHNTFRLVATNRGKTDARVTLSLAGLRAAQIVGVPGAITLKPGDELQREFDVAAAGSAVDPGVNRLRILVHVDPGQKDQSLDETFIAPMEAASPATPAARPD